MGLETNRVGWRVIVLDAQMRSIRKCFGARARDLRKAQHLDVKNAAAALDIDPSTLYSIERGRSTPSFGLIIAMAKLYKVDEAALFVWPGTHVRHDVWEKVRVASVVTLSEAMPEIDQLLAPKKKRLSLVAHEESDGSTPGARRPR